MYYRVFIDYEKDNGCYTVQYLTTARSAGEAEEDCLRRFIRDFGIRFANSCTAEFITYREYCKLLKSIPLCGIVLKVL